MFNYLEREELVSINREVVKLSGDPHGIISEANLNHVIEAVKLKYESQGDSLFLKAAFIIDYLANKGHVFIEGNKRTAETATITFLRSNGFFFEERNQNELADFVLSVARGEKSIAAIEKWLKERIKGASE